MLRFLGHPVGLKFKLRSCLTNDTKFSDLSALRTKIYDFKLMYFLGHPKEVGCYGALSFVLNDDIWKL